MDAPGINHEIIDLVAEATRIRYQLQTLVNLWRREKTPTDRVAEGRSDILKAHLLGVVIPSLPAGMEGKESSVK